MKASLGIQTGSPALAARPPGFHPGVLYSNVQRNVLSQPCGGAPGTQWVELRHAADILQSTEQPHDEESPNPHAHSTKVQKPCTVLAGLSHSEPQSYLYVEEWRWAGPGKC